MPKYTAQNKKIRDAKFLEAVKLTGSAKEAAKMVGRIGSQGSKNPEHSAESMGTKRLKQVEESMLDAFTEEGVTPRKVAKEVKNLLDHKNPMAKDKGISHALKAGVGGGYKPLELAHTFKPFEVTDEQKEYIDNLMDED